MATGSSRHKTAFGSDCSSGDRTLEFKAGKVRTTQAATKLSHLQVLHLQHNVCCGSVTG
jgi:hypothetical protein